MSTSIRERLRVNDGVDRLVCTATVSIEIPVTINLKAGTNITIHVLTEPPKQKGQLLLSGRVFAYEPKTSLTSVSCGGLICHVIGKQTSVGDAVWVRVTTPRPKRNREGGLECPR